MKRTAWVVLGGAVAAALCLQQPSRAAGQLQGQVLRPARDLETGLEAVIGGLLGGRRDAPPPGSIGSVVVAEDGPQRLTISVECTGDLQGRRFRGELLDAGHRYQRQFRTAPVRVEGDECRADLTFEPKEGLSAQSLPVSEYVRVSVDGGGPGLKRLFTLGKAWGGESGDSGSGPASPGVAYLRVKAVPEPKAAALPSVEPTPVPAPVATPPPVRVPRDPTRAPGGVIVTDTPRGRGYRPRVRDDRGESGDRRPEVRDHRGEGHSTWTPAPLAAPVLATPKPMTSAQREAIAAKTAGVLQAMPHSTAQFMTQASAFALSEGDRSKGATGPDPGAQLRLLDVVEMEDGVSLDPAQVTAIGPTLWGDRNPAAGYFYFVPESYHLAWLGDEGRYDMAMLYLAATATGASGEVSMGAGITSGIDADEIRVARELLRAYCQARSCAVSELRPFPVDPGKAAVSIADTLKLFNIPPEKVRSVGVSDALGGMRLAWATDTVTKENVQLVLEESGLDGIVRFQAYDSEDVVSNVNVRIKLGDPRSFKRARWRRGEPWRNPTPFPVRVKYLHALMTLPGRAPAVYSWRLGNAGVPPQVVAPGGRVELDASAVPRWVDAKALRVWVDYAVASGCESCTQQVVKDITGGVTSVTASQITFRTYKPLAQMGAHDVFVKVRSRHFDPEGRQVKTKELALNADDHEFPLGPIYVGEETDGGDETLFEYFLTVSMPSGKQYEARKWLASRGLSVVIGPNQIEEALGFLPGEGS